MKKTLILMSILILLLCACAKKPVKEKLVLARINNYEITEDQFEADFKGSPYARIDTLESRKEFLANLINQKLILQDAQRNNLDKEGAFLKLIEKFWEQSLLKLAVERKSKEIAGGAAVSDKEIEERYEKLLEEGKPYRTYEQAYSQIKWEIAKEKETQIMDSWIEELRKQAKIAIDDDLLMGGLEDK